jgi:N-acetylglucosaminyldiphosphoundecaprenol N-acetyl-beta-D-mannosaminyltransferase
MINLKISGFNFDAPIVGSWPELMGICESALKKRTQGYFCAVNPEKIVNTSKTGLFTSKQEKLLANFADGVGVVLAAQLLESKRIERIAGIDFFMEILKMLDRNKQKLFLFGSSESVLRQTVESISTRYPNIQIVGSEPGYSYENENIIRRIDELSPDVIAVALGSPKQEEWILQQGMKAKSGVYIGVGGTFDVISGNIKRAPQLFRKLGLEWLFRLIKQPSRAIRQKVLPIFLVRVLWEKCFSNHK